MDSVVEFKPRPDQFVSKIECLKGATGFVKSRLIVP